MHTVTVNQRALTSLNEDLSNILPDSRGNQLPRENHLHRLDAHGVLTVEGDNAITFLQGQLTCDMRKLDTRTALPGALCNLKGRIIAMMDVLEWQGTHLVLPRDMIPLVIKAISRAAAFSRVRLRERDDLCVYGFLLRDPAGVTPWGADLPSSPFGVFAAPDFCSMSMAGDATGLYRLLAYKSATAGMETPFREAGSVRGAFEWHRLQLAQKGFEIYPESSGLFLPHRLGLHQTGHLSFDKGCYLGQEIVARMHYKSTVQHHPEIFRATPETPLRSGEPWTDPITGIEKGLIVDYCPPDHPGDDTLIIAIVNTH